MSDRGPRPPGGCHERAGFTGTPTIVMARPARERRPPATTTAGTAWNAGLRPAQPAAGGRREGPPVPRWFLLVANPGVRRDPYLGVAEPFAALRAPHRHPTKADGKEPLAALRAAVPAPTRRNIHDRVLRTPRRARKWRGTHVGLTTRHPPWFRAPARCRPEAGVPSRPRHGAISYTRSHAHPSPRCGESGPSCDGEYEKFGLGTKQPVDKVTRRSAGDASRLNHASPRRSSLRFGRNTLGIPPSRALSAGRLTSLGAHVTLSTGCCSGFFVPD